MDISFLAAKQKRYREWREFLENPSIPTELAAEIEKKLSAYGSLIVSIWDEGMTTADQEMGLKHLERELEMLNESARLQGAKTMGRQFDK